jgi:hypothetical protein
MIKTLLVFLFIQLVGLNLALDNGLARTPPMGWLTWERFRCNIDCDNDPENCISERLIREMADRISDDGYLEMGYEYIIVDDCWLAATRDANNRLQPDAARFPNGIRALADYVHSKGLKFGIYEDFGTLTCGGYPGSIDHLELDAQTFAEWTVDYVKLDGCYADIKLMPEGYPKMGYYLNQTNRPMVYSCSWPAYEVFNNVQPNYTRIAEYCNLWRNYDDIDDSFDSLHTITEWYASQQDTLAPVHGPGNWNDPDMLIIGNYGLSYGQSKAQMALWSIFAAPLIMSVDLRTISPWFKEILLNKNLIAINQDSLGKMGKRFLIRNNVELWSKELENGKTAFVFFYPLPYGTPAAVQVTLKELNLTEYSLYNFYESFSGDLIGQFKSAGTFNTSVEPSGSVVAFWAEPTQKAKKPKVKSFIKNKKI